MLYVSISYKNSSDCVIEIHSVPQLVEIKKEISIKKNSRWIDLRIILAILRCFLTGIRKQITNKAFVRTQ
jgi:hypothetical protein